MYRGEAGGVQQAGYMGERVGGSTVFIDRGAPFHGPVYPTENVDDDATPYICNGCDGTVAARCACCGQAIRVADDKGELNGLGYTCEECIAVGKEARAGRN